MIILTDPNEVLGLVQQCVELEYTIDISSAIPEGEPDYNAKCTLATMVWFPLNGDQSITLDEILNMKRGDKRIFFRKPVSVVQFECDSVWLGDVLNSIRSSGVKVKLIEKVGQTVKRQWGKPVSVVQFECDSVWLGDVLNSIRSSGVKVKLIEKVGQTVKHQWAYNQDVVKDDTNDLVKVAMDAVDEYVTFSSHLVKNVNNSFEFLRELMLLVDIKRQYQTGEVDSERLTGCVVIFNRRWGNHIQLLRARAKANEQ